MRGLNRNMLFLIVAALVGCIHSPAVWAQAPKAASFCHLASSSAATSAPQVSLIVSAGAQQTRTGDPITIEWQVAGALQAICRNPLYLVISTPMRTRLNVIAVGTDTYDDSKIPALSVAKVDAENFAKAAIQMKGRSYGQVDVTQYLDGTGMRARLPGEIRKVAAASGVGDTIMLFAAGHGFRGKSDGRFYLATRETRLDKLEETSISWAEIAAAFDSTLARVIVFLDACHSGAASDGGANDDAVAALMGKGTSITVIAAAKGRQESLEYDNGGAFTAALVRAITADRQATDLNRNGAIELAELYGALKRRVVQTTNGAQTPWVARNQMVGETPLF